MESYYKAQSYLKDFDCYEFVRYIHPTADGTKGQYNRFILDSLHELFQSGIVSGRYLLDVGTGICVYSVISASRHVQEIHLSDLVPNHISILEKWRKGEDLDKPLFEYVISKESDGTELNDRMNEVRRKVTGIHTIDVTKDTANHRGGLKRKYDVITSGFCLDSATKTVAEYAKAFANVATLLKTGGIMVILGTLEESYYRIGPVEFWNANIRRSELLSVFKAAGFEIVFWRERDRPDSFKAENGEFLSDFKYLFIAAAQKCQF